MTPQRRVVGSAPFVVIITGITLSALLISQAHLRMPNPPAPRLIVSPWAGRSSPTLAPSTKPRPWVRQRGDLTGSAGGTLLAPPSVSPQGVIQLRVLHSPSSEPLLVI